MMETIISSLVAAVAEGLGRTYYVLVSSNVLIIIRTIERNKYVTTYYVIKRTVFGFTIDISQMPRF